NVLIKNSTVVSTVMSNIGFYHALEEQGIKSVKTKVGDRFVVEEMRENGYNLGGEQSGHVVFLDLSSTGDGLLTGIQLLHVMKDIGKPLSVLAAEMTTYQQEFINVRVTDREAGRENKRVNKVIAGEEEEMDGDGRVLVRASGTEPLLRVMTEATTQQKVTEYCTKIADVVREKYGLDN